MSQYKPDNPNLIYLAQVDFTKDYSHGIHAVLPLGLLAVGTVLQKREFQIRIVHILENDIDCLISELTKNRPLFVGFSVMTGSQTYHSALASKRIKENLHIPIVWGGPHPSLLPEQCLSEPYIDFVVIGEGEETIIELTEAILYGEKDFDNIKGIGFSLNEKEYKVNEPRSFIKNIDNLTLNYELLDMNQYIFRVGYKNRVVAYKSSRGCPFNCGFCYNLVFNKRQWRAMSAEAVIEDIEWLKKRYHIDGVKLYDDEFYINKERAVQILQKIGIPAHSEIRIDMVDEELAKLWKETNHLELLIGIESASNRLLKLINKGYTVETIRKGADLLSRHNIRTTYSAIFGLPTETPEEFQDTIELLLDIYQTHKNCGFTVGAYLPYPGTSLYDLALKLGFQSPETTEGWGAVDRFRDTFASPFCDIKRVFKIREYFKFLVYHIPVLSRWFEFRLRSNFYRFSFDIPITEFLASKAIRGEGLIGGALRKAHTILNLK
ncbi:MAG: B12-binding domain-containing radical SAM protein [Nitrospirota bacterium]